MARLYEPTENLGSSASVLQYIGSMAQVYSGQAGDSLAGNQAQEVKGVAGENFVLVRESVKAYLQLKDVTLQMEGMVAGSDFSKVSYLIDVAVQMEGMVAGRDFLLIFDVF